MHRRDLRDSEFGYLRQSLFSSRWRIHEPLVSSLAMHGLLIWALIKNFGSSDETRRNPRCFPYMYESLSMYELAILCSSELK